MKLHGQLQSWGRLPNGVFRLKESAPFDMQNELLILREGVSKGCFLNGDSFTAEVPLELGYLSAGDIVKVRPGGFISVLYRKKSQHNSIFITERCNSRCLMCSQPPRDVDDSYLIDDWLTAIPLMSPSTLEMGITGGEPTLSFDGVLQIVKNTKEHLPGTALHMLTNGRLFAKPQYARRMADVGHHDLMLGIPLYSDVEELHDFVVQARGAYNETLLGLLNLARYKQRIELRIVLHRHTVKRLPQLARFICRNLPFVEHVAFMGLEVMGYAKSNLNALWVDPCDYETELFAGVEELCLAGLSPSIYNLPLCTIPEILRQFSRKSISDWKNEYFEECDRCVKQAECCGFFTSSKFKFRKIISPFKDALFSDFSTIPDNLPIKS